MNCPNCDTEVISSNHSPGKRLQTHSYECPKCHLDFSATEALDYESLVLIEGAGWVKTFRRYLSHRMLFDALKESGYPESRLGTGLGDLRALVGLNVKALYRTANLDEVTRIPQAELDRLLLATAQGLTSAAA